MRNLLGRYVNRYEKKHRDFRRYAMIVAVLALVVFVGVNWRLHDKGISMTSDYQCGLKEHKHTADCYKKVLICGKEETDGSEGHTHTDACYKEEKKLTCDKEEHKHNADCYDEEGNLICDKEEHTHSEDCYTTEKKLICGKEESKPVKEHHHTDACYKKELVCKLKEHTHTASCYSNENADVEDKSDWEATIPTLSGNWAEDIVSVAESQIGYEESTANFKLADDGETRKGYTRYGDWYGNKYGDWSAMFASFCLNYAGISSKTVPVNSGSTAWITELKQKDLYKTADNHNPTTGDLVFLDTDSDGKADHVGIITGTETKDDVEDSKVTSLTAIVGDSNDAVEENTYEISSDTIVGYCALPENPDEKKDAEVTTAEAAEKKTVEESAKSEATTAKAAESGKKTGNKAKSEENTETSGKTATQSGDGSKIFNALTAANTDSTGESEAVFFIQKADDAALVVQNEDKGIATQDADDAIDFGQYITSAVMKKLVGNSWTDATEFQDGDQVKVRLDYKIPANIVTQDKRTITYQLPDGVRLSKEENGIVSGTIDNVYYSNLGTYTIYTNGKIIITFNDTFLQTNEEFNGYIEFQGTASNTSTSTEKDFTIGANGNHYTIKPKPVENDLTVKKTASKSENERKVRYTIMVSSKNGTDKDKVKVSDSLNFSGLKDVTIENITVKDKNDNDVSYNMKYTGTGDGYKNFEITDLPALEAGETYTITYDVDYGETISKDGSASLNNTAIGFKGNAQKSSSHVYTEISKKIIEKLGWVTDNNTMIQWNIKVNPDRMDGVAGEYTLKDVLKKGDSDVGLDLEKAEGFKITETDKNGKSTVVTDTAYKDGKLTIKDGCSYEITYKTPVTGDEGAKHTYNNEASLDGGGKDYSGSATVTVTVPSGVKKEGKGTQKATADTAIAKWQATLVLSSIKEGNKITYEDNLYDQDGNINPDIHYTTVSQLKGTLKLSCEIANSSQQTDITDYILTCYNKDGEVVTETDDASAKDTRVVRFKITEVAKPAGGKNLFVSYSTTMYTAGLKEGETLTVKNEGKFDGKTAPASNNYTKPKRIFKYGTEEDSNGNISYKAGSSSVNYEVINGKLHYRIIINPETTDQVTITDKLPEGLTVDPKDVKVRFIYGIGSNNYIYDTESNYSLTEKDHSTVTVDGQDLSVVIKAGFPAKIAGDEAGFCIEYVATINDSFWDDLKNDDKPYTNTVSWNGRTEEQVTEVTRHTEVVSKDAEQVMEEGKTTNKVKYYVMINPAGEKLNNGRNITLTDKMSSGKMLPQLNVNSVKLYSYDGRAKDNHYKGTELDAAVFTFQYDASNKIFTATIPDGTPCVLEYEYEIDYNGENGGQLRNDVELIGKSSEQSSKIITIQEATSGAGASKGSRLEIVKVDSTRYQLTLKGAKFEISLYDNSNNPKWKSQGEYTTDEDGTIDIRSTDIKGNQLYSIQETKAPDNYSKTDKNYYFVWLGINGSEKITADEWWNKYSNTLESSIKKEDIYFITGETGTIIIPNDYSKLEVKKLWTDADGKKIDGTGSVKVKLKKVTQKIDGYNVTINYRNKNNNNTINYSEKYVVKKNGKIVLTFNNSNPDEQYYTLPDQWSSSYDSNKRILTIESNNITSDQTLDIARTWDWYHNEVVTPDKPDYLTISEDVTGVENPITLSNSNNWTYSWDELPRTESDGTPISYAVEEVDNPSGYTVSYTGNDGIQSGQITIINKKDKNSYTLPETGGSGTLPFITVGASLMGFALLCGYSMRRRRGRRVE